MLMPPGVVAPFVKDLPGAPVMPPVVARRELAVATAFNNKHPREPFTVLFNTAGTHTWIAPLDTLVLDALAGMGAAGEPEVPEDLYYTYEKTVTTYNAANEITAGPTVTPGEDSGEAPPDGCTGVFGSGGSRTETCYNYTQHGTDYQPPTTGTSASAFGIAFPGGAGGAATPAQVKSAIHVTPGAPYTIMVPDGGYVSFSYHAGT